MNCLKSNVEDRQVEATGLTVGVVDYVVDDDVDVAVLLPLCIVMYMLGITDLHALIITVIAFVVMMIVVVNDDDDDAIVVVAEAVTV